MIDSLKIPPGTLCYVNELAGEVWMAQGVPAIRWLYDAELDAWAATVTDYGPRPPIPARLVNDVGKTLIPDPAPTGAG